jgi:hypothetical protein
MVANKSMVRIGQNLRLPAAGYLKCSALSMKGIQYA